MDSSTSIKKPCTCGTLPRVKPSREPIIRRPLYSPAIAAAALTAMFASAAVSPAAPLAASLRKAISKIPSAEADFGICVVDLQTGTTVFSDRADDSLVPASTMKVFTMVTSLADLGSEFSFRTVLATDGPDLYVVGDGDPAIGDEKLHRRGNAAITSDFERWASILTQRGLSEITGDLVIDESIFDDQWVSPSWEESDLDNWYAAPVGGLNFNDNCVDITVHPASRKDALVSVSVQPPNNLVQIVNKCRTGGNGKAILHHLYDTFEYRVSGRCKKRWRFGPVSFPDPGLLFAEAMRTSFAGAGIMISGDTRRSRVRMPDGSLPPNLTVIADRTTPLVDILPRVGKSSQNLFAECLVKRLGFEKSRRNGAASPQGSWAAGSRAIEECVARAGVNTKGLSVADGSGLSRDNACTARQLAEILMWAHRQPFANVLYESLSVAGIDGSMRKRLRKSSGQVHAKTGTMRGISALAGYVGTESAPRFAFSVIFNNYKGASTPYKRIQDNICTILLAAGGTR